MIYESRLKKQNWAGETIGIIVLECDYPFIPGNVANATTFNFPVRYAAVDGVNNHHLIYQRDPSLLTPFIQAAQKLEAEGVRAITGACGFMALFQEKIAASVSVPTFLSSLMQIPFIHHITRKRIGIISADKSQLTQEHFIQSGVDSQIPITIGGMENNDAFRKAIFFSDGTLDNDAIQEGVIAVAQTLQAKHDDLGAILLECSDLPPYAHAIQAATGLPIFDFITMINYVHETLVRRPFHGFM